MAHCVPGYDPDAWTMYNVIQNDTNKWAFIFQTHDGNWYGQGWNIYVS